LVVGDSELRCWVQTSHLARFLEIALNLIARPWVWFLAGSLVTATPVLAQGQKYKCAGKDGKIEFSNMACATNTAASTVTVKPNSIDSSGMREQSQKALDRRQQEVDQAESARRYQGSAGAAGNECPSELELRNMETQAASVTLGKKEREFLQDEIRRAMQCRSGQGNCTAKHWQQSQEARAAQNSLTDRAGGRGRAEAMHGLADPAEAERIRAARAADEQQRAARQGARAPESPIQATRCSGESCWSNDGTRYKSTGGGWYSGPQGSCRKVGNTLQCP
jgi:hypothetical protein